MIMVQYVLAIEKSSIKVGKYQTKDIEVNIEINKYGMYIITFYFKNKDTFFNKIRLFFRRKNKPMLQAKSMNYENNKYGQYKETKTYRPY